MERLVRTKKYIIIVAAGKGNRMGAENAKQFLLLDGKPILIHTIDKFLNHPNHFFEIILVLNKSHLEIWDHLCQQYHYLKPIKIVIGGNERFHSVKNAIDTITDNQCYIGIHDGVRPFVSETVIHRAFSEVIKHGAIVPVVAMIPTIRITDGEDNRSMNRSDFKVVQTPQVFKSEIIKAAYQTPYQSSFFDDATVAEYCGYTIKLVEGNEENIKITLPIDYITAKALQKTKLIHDISY
ncbi:2-C-methyl-D-erythritol 4-phosphate cytidylyltransferase [Chryseobacterium jejuense]|uniref:2-C-methyl-D-erythritol 4-phosphate cytidylyltransferase n=1 Tax=Chryseobacterium jejuense TaxID=445960 RepID=UPI001AE34584|nr:2-C-methyl-D-erythritol 4-phosphate cytidylyltransferase [Chryseobacterium jejuense]MBP2616643.1 2-C-methyl-D-erythritol 4-phosphate cytidylyltransferase [Chryseobacterium jejuense]